MEAATITSIVTAITSTATSAVAIGGLIFTIKKAGRDASQARADRLDDLSVARAAHERDVERARADKRGETVAEVAAETLVATLRFLTALNWRVGIDVRDRDHEGDGPRSRLSRDVADRWESFAHFFEKLGLAWEQALVYLPNSVADLIHEVLQLQQRIRSAQERHVADGDREAFASGFGGVPQKQIVALIHDAKELLRPLAQLRV